MPVAVKVKVTVQAAAAAAVAAENKLVYEEQYFKVIRGAFYIVPYVNMLNIKPAFIFFDVGRLLLEVWIFTPNPQNTQLILFNIADP
jgi:hypothetical protein